VNPAQQDAVLGLYERALSLTHAMLEAARKGNWDELVRLEAQRSQVVDQIRLDDPDPARTPALVARKRQIMTELLQADERVQLLTQDWMHELREVLGSVSGPVDPDGPGVG
jgi:flagellar protein FliT